MSRFLDLLGDFWPALLVLLITGAIVAAATWVARRSQEGTSGALYQLLNWIVISLALVVIIILLPITDETQGQILSLLGVVLTAVIALSSTTFVSNAMAGVMLHMTKPFRPGDYLRVNDQFGRVTRRSLVHTKIQTEWRDITTLPNLLLLNNPITVMHRDGTIISAEVSIGYDETYNRIEELLLAASESAGLREPFVLVQELLDHAVVYRVCGFLVEMNHPISARSTLRKKVLEQLHGNGVEIVSPSFVNQRRMDPSVKVMPEKPVLYSGEADSGSEPAPEEKIFDQAEQAATLEELKQQQEEVRQAVKREKAHLKTVPADQREGVKQAIAQLEQKEKSLAQRVEAGSAK